jgi:hypothetical protein
VAIRSSAKFQETCNKVQVLRVSVVAVNLNGRTEAARASPAAPNPMREALTSPSWPR